MLFEIYNTYTTTYVLCWTMTDTKKKQLKGVILCFMLITINHYDFIGLILEQTLLKKINVYTNRTSKKIINDIKSDDTMTKKPMKNKSIKHYMEQYRSSQTYQRLVWISNLYQRLIGVNLGYLKVYQKYCQHVVPILLFVIQNGYGKFERGVLWEMNC